MGGMLASKGRLLALVAVSTGVCEGVQLARLMLENVLAVENAAIVGEACDIAARGNEFADGGVVAKWGGRGVGVEIICGPMTILVGRPE
jgi:hypothetical protein